MQSWGLTDVGCVRKQNQDAFHIEKLDRHSLLAVVCDGMGGAKSGNVASSLAVDVFVQEVTRNWTSQTDWDKCDMILRSAVKLANFTVYDQACQFEEFSGMGTTLVAAVIRKNQASIINVGDSRCYAITNGSIRQVTKDHSVVQMMVDRGDLTPETAKTVPGKNLITRAVGTEPTILSDIYRQDLEKGSFLFLCSDGLSNMLDDQEILFEVVHGVKKQNCCKRLLNIAKMRGSPDNVTSILVSV